MLNHALQKAVTRNRSQTRRVAVTIRLPEEVVERIDSLLMSRTSASESNFALVSRHKKVVTDSIANISDAIEELNIGNDEVCSMILRATYREISQIQQHNIDDQILEQIFSKFCIGK